ncbi:MAG: sulfite exporter TauE/SafE family protein [Puniceicoccaceae bacterium]
MPEALPILLLAFAAVAFLYASVGHGGASGYLAAMTLVGLSPLLLKPTALSLNIAVSALALVAFARKGYFSPRLFWPFALPAIPASFVGGLFPAGGPAFRLLLAAALLISAWRLIRPHTRSGGEGEAAFAVRPPAPWIAGAIGVVMGLVSGWIGVGGGIFLTPVLIFCGWADARHAAAVSAPFILVNSIAGLGGWFAGGGIPGYPAALVAAALPCVIVAGWLGASVGSGRLPLGGLRKTLAAVLCIAAFKSFGLLP